MVSVVVLIALIVIAIICAGLLKLAAARRNSAWAEERRAQSVLLAESGLERAGSRLAGSSDYAGETWAIPAQDFGGRGSATVLIRVEKLTDRPNHRKISVQADYPADSNLRSRASREIIVSTTSLPR
jgi:Tfp pilus assembly protein PilV